MNKIKLKPGDIIYFNIPISISEQITFDKSKLELVLSKVIKRYFQELKEYDKRRKKAIHPIHS